MNNALTVQVLEANQYLLDVNRYQLLWERAEFLDKEGKRAI
jgi:hypothetical protein